MFGSLVESRPELDPFLSIDHVDLDQPFRQLELYLLTLEEPNVGAQGFNYGKYKEKMVYNIIYFDTALVQERLTIKF